MMYLTCLYLSTRRLREETGELQDSPYWAVQSNTVLKKTRKAARRWWRRPLIPALRKQIGGFLNFEFILVYRKFQDSYIYTEKLCL